MRNKIGIALLITIAAVVCSLFYTSPAQAVSYDITAYFPIIDTDTRTYTGGISYVNGTKTINSTTTMRYHYADGSEEYYTCDSSGFRMYGLSGLDTSNNWFEFIFSSPLTVTPQYVEVGQTYTGSTSFVYSGYTFNVNSSLTVNSLEDVTVSSGAIFKNAVKVTWTLTMTCPALGGSTASQQIWMSTNIGPIKQYWPSSGATALIRNGIAHHPSIRKKAELLVSADGSGFIYYEYLDENYSGRGYGRVYKKQKADGSYLLLQYWGTSDIIKIQDRYSANGALAEETTYYESGHIKFTTLTLPDSMGNVYYEYYDGSGRLLKKKDSNNVIYEYTDEDYLGSGYGKLTKKRNSDGSYSTFSDYYTGTRQYRLEYAYNAAGILVAIYEYDNNGNLLKVSTPAPAPEFDIEQITDNSTNDECVFLNDNGEIVWAGKATAGSEFDIFYYGKAAITQLTSDSVKQASPCINNAGTIVWSELSGSGYQILRRDGQGTAVICFGNSNILPWPQINDEGDIVFHGWDGNDWEIYRYDNSSGTIQSITDNSVNDYDPDINNAGDIMWHQWDGNDYEIMLKKGADIIQITDNIWDDIGLRGQLNNSGHITWYGFKDGSNYYGPTDAEIYFYNGSQVIQITDNESQDFNPALNDNDWIVWEREGHIYVYDGVAEYQVTTGDPQNAGPIINNNNEIAWYGQDGNDAEVYKGTPITGSVPILVLADSRIVIDFGTGYGIWIYDSLGGGTWSQLHTISPDSMAAADLDNDEQNIEDLVIDFGADYGIWIYYNNSTWQQLHNVSAKSIVTADLDNNGQGEIIIDFGSGYGIWVYYNNSTWIQLHTLSADSIVPAHEPGNNILCIDFGPSYGIWTYEPASTMWSQLHTVSPEIGVTADIDNDGWDEGVIDFGSSYGIWVYEPNGGAWSQIHTVSPESITVGNIDADPKEDLMIDFGTGYGIWIYANNSTWSQLHSASADSITAGDLNGNGIDELIVDFGPSDGVWVYQDDGTWTQLHTVSP